MPKVEAGTEEPAAPEYRLRMTVIEGRDVVFARWLWIDVDWPSAFPLHMVRERWWDHVAKAIDFAREQQTGDPAFDARVYLDTDDAAAATALCATPAARRAILALLDAGALSLAGADGELTAKFTWPGGFSRTATPAAETDAARAWLGGCVDALQVVLSDAPAQPIAMKVSRLVPVLRIGGAILFAAILLNLAAMLASAKIVDPDYVRRGLGDAEIFGLAISAALLLGVAARLRGRATATRLLAGAVALIVPVVAMLPVGLLPVANDLVDRSPVKTIVRPIVDKTLSRGRYGTTYRAYVDYWRTPRQLEGFIIDAAEYDDIILDRDCLEIDTHTGGLGFERVTRHAVEACAVTDVAARRAEPARAVPGPGWTAWRARLDDYPVAALADHLTGSVEAIAEVGTDGRILAVGIARGSGSTALDDHVRDTLLSSDDVLAPPPRGVKWLRLPRIVFRFPDPSEVMQNGGPFSPCRDENCLERPSFPFPALQPPN